MQFRSIRPTLFSCMAFCLAALPAAAENVADFYKGKTVRILIGSSVGGTFGFYSQLTASHIGRFLPGSPNIIVQAMTGASGNVALNYAQNAGPQDGTLLILPNLTIVQETLFNPSIRYDARAFQYIGRYADVLGVAAASQQSGIKTLDDARVKEHTMGTVGTQNMTYWGPALMNLIGGTKFRIISGYAGTPDTHLAIQRGEVDAFITSWTTLKINHATELKDGKLVPIFGVATRRLDDLPNIPVVTEFGRTDAERALLRIVTVSNELGRFLAGPPKMPAHLVEAWRTAFDKMAADPSFQKDVITRGGDLNAATGQELAKIVKETTDLPKDTIDQARNLYDKLFPKAK